MPSKYLILCRPLLLHSIFLSIRVFSNESVLRIQRAQYCSFSISTSNKQSILKETSPGCSLEGLMLELKLQYFGHLMRRTDSMEKTLMLGRIEGRRRGRHRMRQLDGTTDSMGMSLSKLREIVKKSEDWCAAVHGVPKSWTRLID